MSISVDQAIKEEMMHTLILYDSQYGNTERIAHAIADALATPER